MRQNFNKEIEEIKRKYEQKIEKKDEKIKIDLQEINKLSVEIKHKHENEKQQVCLYKNKKNIKSFLIIKHIKLYPYVSNE